VVTGAGRGIGRAIAVGLALAGADVLVTARSAGELAETAAAVIPGMITAGWGRIVNVSSGIVAGPGSMIGGNACAATKAALEAHSRNLAAELAGTGVTVNVYRPGGVDTAMQAWIRSQDPARIGPALHERFRRSSADGGLLTAEASAAALLGHLAGPDGERTGAIWDRSQTVKAGDSGAPDPGPVRLPLVLG
jgi:NAD(P)-dependent dehydrogenase (short-subunit alcohol dehydrogenase family)